MIYISGKIANDDVEIKKKNLERFFEVEESFKEKGEVCYNPARNELKNPDWTYEQFLVEDLLTIWFELPDMYFTKGWESSRGARLEHELAQRLGLHCDYE